MPTSATGRSTNRSPAAAGFTLLELVVVLAIVGVLVTVAGIAVPDRARSRLEHAATRLAATLEDCRRGAVLSGAPGGVRLSRDGYELLTYRGEWLAAQVAHARRRLAPELVLVDAAPANAQDAEEPSVVCLPSGETHRPDIRITFRERAGYVELTSDENGDIVTRWVGPT